MAAIPVCSPWSVASRILVYASTGYPERSANTAYTWSTDGDVRRRPTTSELTTIMDSRRVLASKRADASCSPLTVARAEPCQLRPTTRHLGRLGRAVKGAAHLWERHIRQHARGLLAGCDRSFP